jgi:hypothetical protein
MKTKRYRWQIRSLLFGFIFLAPPSTIASFDEGLHGARQGALAQTICAIPNTIENMSFNPAAIWTTSKLTSHLFYSNPFGLPDVKTGSLFTTFSRNLLTIGFGYSTFGNEIYNESTTSFATALKFNEAIFLGANIRYGRLNIAGYGNAGTFLLDGGVLIRIMDQLYWGSTVRNISNSKIGQTAEDLAQLIATGIHYKPTNLISVNIDLAKEIRFPADLRTGIEIQPHNNLILRVGLSSEPQKMAAGLGLDFGNHGIDYGFNSHSELGHTHLFSAWFKLFE